MGLRAACSLVGLCGEPRGLRLSILRGLMAATHMLVQPSRPSHWAGPTSTPTLPRCKLSHRRVSNSAILGRGRLGQAKFIAYFTQAQHTYKQIDTGGHMNTGQHLVHMVSSATSPRDKVPCHQWVNVLNSGQHSHVPFWSLPEHLSSEYM